MSSEQFTFSFWAGYEGNRSTFCPWVTSYTWAVPAEHDSSSGARARAVTVETELQSGPFTFMHLADPFTQSDLQCIQVIPFCQYLCSLGIKPKTFCAANAMLYHWATGTLIKQQNAEKNHSLFLTEKLWYSCFRTQSIYVFIFTFVHSVS